MCRGKSVTPVMNLLNIASTDQDNFYFEKELRLRGYTCIAGTDEVGRGPLAGPVVAACVSLPEDCDPSPFTDSKKTTHKQRIHLAEILRTTNATIGLGIVSHQMIDKINILQASLFAMRLSVYNHAAARENPDYLLVDGKFEVPLQLPQQTLVKGETRSASIAAASIIAKLKRDAIMEKLHLRFPQYGFNRNKGYPTKAHKQAVEIYGPCPFHRQTFKGVREFVTEAD